MKRLIILLAAIYTLLSCEKERVDMDSLNFTNASFEYDVAISGFISTERTRHRVTLTSPVPIHSGAGYTPISDAAVTLTDGVNTYPFEWNQEQGAYYSADSIQGVPGVYYTLEVQHNGMSYSASDTLPLEPVSEYINPYNRVTSFDDRGKPRPFDYSWIQLSLQQHAFGYDRACIMLFFDQFNLSDSLRGVYYDLVGLNDVFRAYIHKGSLPQGVFPAGFTSTGSSGEPTDSIELIYMAISDAYYQYLISVFNETNWKAGIFSTIAGNTKGNVSKGGAGYFYAVNVSRFRMTFWDLVKD